MQNQNTPSLNTQAETTGPVEIDAKDLHLIGGGAPKGTWGPVEGAASAAPAVATLSGGSDAPKGTW